MRKTLSFLLVLALVAAIFCGCANNGGQQTSEDTITQKHLAVAQQYIDAGDYVTAQAVWLIFLCISFRRNIS